MVISDAMRSDIKKGVDDLLSDSAIAKQITKKYRLYSGKVDRTFVAQQKDIRKAILFEHERRAK